jgi:hypothetical protein
MPIDLQTAMIAAVVALLASGVTAAIGWKQLQREKAKWLLDLKAQYTLELYKIRFEEYQKLNQIIGQLSRRPGNTPTTEIGYKVGEEINGWYFARGGLCTSRQTRSAVIKLRDFCLMWKTGDMPRDVRDWWLTVEYLMRRDLDLISSEEVNRTDVLPLLEEIDQEMKKFTK